MARVQGSHHVVVSTAGVFLFALAKADLDLWPAVRAGCVRETFVRDLEASARAPRELLAPDNEYDPRLYGVRPTRELLQCLRAAEHAADVSSGDEPTDLRIWLLIAILRLDNEVSGCLSELEAVELAYEISRRCLGGVVHQLDDLVTEGAHLVQITSESGIEFESLRPERHDPLTGWFVTGLGVSCAVLFVLGIPPWLLLLVASLSLGASTRSSFLQSLGQRVHSGVAVTVLLLTVLSSMLGLTRLDPTLSGLSELDDANQAVMAGDPEKAVFHAAGAHLAEPLSATALVTQACALWSIGWKDESADFFQLAIDNGFAAGQATGYGLGRECHYDLVGVGSFEVFELNRTQWILYPDIMPGDTVSERLVEIARTGRDDGNPAVEWLALACVADRYDLRQLAAHHLTIGINTWNEVNDRPVPYNEVTDCMEKMQPHYKFDGNPGLELFFPADGVSRIYSPSSPTPPPDACWINFPRSGPCNG